MFVRVCLLIAALLAVIFLTVANDDFVLNKPLGNEGVPR
jgi:hypothetical protein